MKKLILLFFGLLIAASAAYCIPKELKELKVKPLIEKVFTIDQEVPAIIVDEINLSTDDTSPWLPEMNYDNSIIEENVAIVVPADKYRWQRSMRTDLSITLKTTQSKKFIKAVKRPDKK